MKIDLLQSVKRFDFFGEQIPSFNVRGISVVKTSTGACVSLCITALTIAFSLLKLHDLLSHKNPTMSSYAKAVDKDEKFDMANSEFMIAFALEHFETGPKDNPKYIQWTVSSHTVKDNE